MRIWYNNILDNSRSVLDVRDNRVRIGKNPDNDIVLSSPLVAGEAAVLYGGGAKWELVVLGRNGCRVGDRPLPRGAREPVAGGQVIEIFPFTLLLEPDDAGAAEASPQAALDRELAVLIRAVHLELLQRMDLGTARPAAQQESDEYLLALEQTLEEIVRLRGSLDVRGGGLTSHIAGHCARRELLGRLSASTGARAAAPWQARDNWRRLFTAVPERERELGITLDRLTTDLGLPRIADLSEQSDRVEQRFWPAWERAAAHLNGEFLHYLALRHLRKEIKDIVFGYGPLEDLLQAPTVSEIMVVDRDRIYVEKHGVVENSGRQFVSDEITLSIIERIVARVGRRIDRSSPLVDARLTDGSRVNAVIPPLAVSGPCLTVRKFPLRRLMMPDLVARGALTETVAHFLRAAVITRRNILISGGTGTGKTTLLNCLSDYIPDKERIVTVEDTAELQLQKEHVVQLEARPANVEGAGAYTIGDLVRNALRMRPDRIVVGECRGKEALDMLQAMNTGHDGSMTTLHANTADDVVLRLEVLVQMAAELSLASIHRQIASAIDLVVQLTRLHNGRRLVSQVTQFVGVEVEGGIVLKDLFTLDEASDRPQLSPTGRLPTFMGELIASGLVDLATFYR